MQTIIAIFIAAIIFVTIWRNLPKNRANRKEYQAIQKQKEDENKRKQDAIALEEQYRKELQVTPDEIKQFYDDWNAVRHIEFDETKINDNNVPLKWFTLDEKYDYLKGLQERVTAQFHHDFAPELTESSLFSIAAVIPKYREDLSKRELRVSYNRRGTQTGTYDYIPNNGQQIEYLKSFVNKHLPQNIMRKNYAEGKEFSPWGLLDDLKMNGLDVDKWYSDYKRVLYPFSQYVQQRIINEGINSELEIIEKGIRGEDALEKELNLLDERYHKLYNVRVVEDDVSAESDAIIVCRQGIFTIEAKNFSEEGHYAIHIAKDGKWSKVIGDRRIEMKDVIAQNNHHVLTKQKLLNRVLKERGLLAKDKYLDIEGLITITNNTVDIHNESNFPIVRLSHIYSHIRKYEVIYTDDQVDAIVDILKEHMQPAQRFPITDFEKEYEIYREFALPKFQQLHKLYGLYDIELKDYPEI